MYHTSFNNIFLGVFVLVASSHAHPQGEVWRGSQQASVNTVTPLGQPVPLGDVRSSQQVPANTVTPIGQPTGSGDFRSGSQQASVTSVGQPAVLGDVQSQIQAPGTTQSLAPIVQPARSGDVRSGQPQAPVTTYTTTDVRSGSSQAPVTNVTPTVLPAGSTVTTTTPNYNTAAVPATYPVTQQGTVTTYTEPTRKQKPATGVVNAIAGGVSGGLDAASNLVKKVATPNKRRSITLGREH